MSKELKPCCILDMLRDWFELYGNQNQERAEKDLKLALDELYDYQQKDQQIADLEAKLAEKEEQLRESRKWFLECDKERLSEETKKNIAFTNYQETLQENKKLKQRLEEIKNVKAQELADYLHTSIPKYIVNEKVELLEKVKADINTYNKEHCFLSTEIDTCNKSVEIIDNQIEELKKEMK